MSKIKLRVKSDILSIKLPVVHDFMFKKLGCFYYVKLLPGFPRTEGEGEGGGGRKEGGMGFADSLEAAFVSTCKRE